MIRQLLLLPLLFFTFWAVAEDALEAEIRTVLKSVSVGKFKSVEITGNHRLEFDNLNIRTIEPQADCKTFELSKDDVLKFFQIARIISEKDSMFFNRDGESRCGKEGVFVLHDGRSMFWEINKNRHASIALLSDSGIKEEPYLFLYCDECQNSQYYPLKGEESFSNFRQTIKSVTIQENGVPFSFSEERKPEKSDYKYCKNYRLSKPDVMEFYKIARTASLREFQLRSHNPVPSCSASGTAVSDKGEKVEWYIGNDRYGYLIYTNGASKINQSYYCSDCNPKVFEEDCDYTCQTIRLD